MFVGLARDRFDSLISSPSATFVAHARTLALLLVIFANDVLCIKLFMSNHGKAPIGHLTLWLFDTVVAGLEAAAIMVKYGGVSPCTKAIGLRAGKCIHLSQVLQHKLSSIQHFAHSQQREFSCRIKLDRQETGRQLPKLS